MAQRFVAKHKTLSKAEYLKRNPSARYSGGTIRNEEGKIVRGPGFYVNK